MHKRLVIAKKLMVESGSIIMISIDENECHNLKVMCDDIF